MGRDLCSILYYIILYYIILYYIILCYIILPRLTQLLRIGARPRSSPITITITITISISISISITIRPRSSPARTGRPGAQTCNSVKTGENLLRPIGNTRETGENRWKPPQGGFCF